jgi:hypothetical protein
MEMFWTLAPSMLFKGSYVQGELLAMGRGYLEPARSIRFDGSTKKVNVVHNGQWFESMDTETRRFWEIEFGADLTLPYKSSTISTIKDITQNTKSRFVSFSGTAGKELQGRMKPHKIDIVGVGSKGAPNLELQIHSSPGGKMRTISSGLKRNLLHDFRRINSGGQADSLLVLSLPDTTMVKQVTKYMKTTGVQFSASEITPKVLRNLQNQGYRVDTIFSGKNIKGYRVKLKDSHMSKVISDSELLRTQMPKARIEAQMNLDGLTPGGVKMLILDTRVGGRGLDLNFKGQRGAGPFKGYNKFEMQIHDPQVASEAHFLQAQGRIDLGRVNTNAKRNFLMVMDVPSSAKEVVFLKMLRDEPLMMQLRQRASVVQRANARGKIHPEWMDVHNDMMAVESKAARHSGKLPSRLEAELSLAKKYRDMVRRNLDSQMLEVEKDQLRSSSVLQDEAMFNWLNRGMNQPPSFWTRFKGY